MHSCVCVCACGRVCVCASNLFGPSDLCNVRPSVMAFQAPVQKSVRVCFAFSASSTLVRGREVMDAAARLRLALHVHDQEWRGIRVVSRDSLVAAVSSFRGVRPRSAFACPLSVAFLLLGFARTPQLIELETTFVQCEQKGDC